MKRTPPILWVWLSVALGLAAALAVWAVDSITPGSGDLLINGTAQITRLGLGNAADGTASLKVAGQVLLSDGAVGAPSLAPASNPDCGIFWNAPTSSQMDFVLNGTAIGRVFSAGLNLGTAKLHWGSSVGATDVILTRDGAAATLQMGDDAASPVAQFYKGPDGSGTDKNGGDWTISGGQSTGAGTPGTLRVRQSFVASTGSSANAYTTAASIGGALKVDTTTTGNIGAGEDDLISYTIPANQLGVNGAFFEFDVFGTFAANTNPKALKVKYGATTIFDTTALIFNGLDWHVHGKIIRTSATAQKAIAIFTVAGTLLGATTTTSTDYTAPAETLSGTVILKCTGQDSGGVPVNDSVVQEGLVLKWYPAP